MFINSSNAKEKINLIVTAKQSLEEDLWISNKLAIEYTNKPIQVLVDALLKTDYSCWEDVIHRWEMDGWRIPPSNSTQHSKAANRLFIVWHYLWEIPNDFY